MTSMFLCPVCFYKLSDPPANYSICECCGTEFGNDDDLSCGGRTYVVLRQAWIDKGCPWFFGEPPSWWSEIQAVIISAEALGG